MELAVPTSQSLDIVLLRTFLEVVDSGGFALAADNLALTLRSQRAYQAPGTDSRRQPAQPHHSPPGADPGGRDALRLCPQHRRAGARGPRQAARHADPRPPAHRRFGGLRQRLAATRPATLSPLAPRSIHRTQGRYHHRPAPPAGPGAHRRGVRQAVPAGRRRRRTALGGTAGLGRGDRDRAARGRTAAAGAVPEPCVYREAAITASAPLRVPGAWCSRAPAWPAACPPRWPVSP